MPPIFRESIFALSSGKLPSGLAVVRVSGRGVRFALETFFGRVPAPRMAAYGAFSSIDATRLDSGLATFFPGPRSFTGEDCCEFHLHGGRAVLAAMLGELGRLPDFRQAEAGEFTRRAFLNGKMDLTGAEGLADLIAAETETQRRLALGNMSGAQRELYGRWSDRLLQARAIIEAELDFSDQEDVPGSLSAEVWDDMQRLDADIAMHMAGVARSEMVRHGMRVVLLGAPNSGKSSLLNALARRDVAIVSDEPGTTRDLVEVQLDLDGNKVVLTDTAGLREQPGTVEAIGIERARKAADDAHLVLMLEDVSAPVAVGLPALSCTVWSIGTKTDLAAAQSRSYDHEISIFDSKSIEDLLQKLSFQAATEAGDVSEVLPTRLRHAELLGACRSELGNALADPSMPIELRGEHLRLSAFALGRIVGGVDVEDLLGAIFSKFCIGK